VELSPTELEMHSIERRRREGAIPETVIRLSISFCVREPDCDPDHTRKLIMTLCHSESNRSPSTVFVLIYRRTCGVVVQHVGRRVWVWQPIADERVGVQVKLWDPLRTRAEPERFWGDDSLKGAKSCVIYDVLLGPNGRVFDSQTMRGCVTTPGSCSHAHASVTTQHNLVPAKGRRCCAARHDVTTHLAESIDCLPPGLYLRSPAGWLPRTGISSGTQRSYRDLSTGLPLPPTFTETDR